MREITIKFYEFQDLNWTAKLNVMGWLDAYPIEYQDNDGNWLTQSWFDVEENHIQDHCEVNGYLFSTQGKPIHHLIDEPWKDKTTIDWSGASTF